MLKHLYLLYFLLFSSLINLAYAEYSKDDNLLLESKQGFSKKDISTQNIEGFIGQLGNIFEFAIFIMCLYSWFVSIGRYQPYLGMSQFRIPILLNVICLFLIFRNVALT